jgi:hypothetical protein
MALVLSWAAVGVGIAAVAPQVGFVQARGESAVQDVRAAPTRGHAFYFTRAIYTDWYQSQGGRGRFGRGSWSVDWPKADIQFLIGLTHLTNLDAYEEDNPVRFDDPEIRRFPFVYALEVGYMNLTDSEVLGLREYLQAGGFLVIDDFWGLREWYNFEQQMYRVFPEYAIVDIPMDHPVLHSFYDIDEILQVPARNRGVFGRPTWEDPSDTVPRVRGVFDDEDQLIVIINYNTDLGDAWEWAEDPWYPLDRANFAYQLGVNMIVYAMTH